MASVYHINKGVNKPIEFKGLKAQYIWYLGGAVFILFLLYAGLYFIGLNQYLTLLIVGLAGTIAVMKIYKLSNTYGQYGMMKALARRAVPKAVICRSRKVFFRKVKGETGK